MRAELHDLVEIPGGAFTMGAGGLYPEEVPVRRVTAQPFRIDRAPVTNGQFGAFVEATGYVTIAERRPDQRRFPGAPPGSAVFRRTRGPVDLRDPLQWWAHVPGACWFHPTGPRSGLDGLADHPVVHISLLDALAYADWAGLSIPTEIQWERAARGGLEGATYAWGEELAPGGRHMANTWQGQFPWENARQDGYELTSPVGAFPPNGYGLVDMIGNVWEWTSDPFRAPRTSGPRCCSPPRPRVEEAFVLKGGSHLCAPNYCRRYRPAARTPETAETSTSHIGFRCASAASRSGPGA